MMTDPLADMLARIRNAILARHEHTLVPASKLKEKVAQILKAEGYIEDYKIEQNRFPVIQIQLKYGAERQSAIAGLKRASRPGRRFYVGHEDIPEVHNGMGLAILSTSKGVLSDHDARKERVGGEVLCEVW
ncbi:MAG: 30S ribosomal protein S8 [Myxococcales bacterium]|nr:MAG: 30S ribosomal protein S8 [Myxococcales bacterium]